MPASAVEKPMYCSEVRWKELRRLPSSGSHKPRIEAAVRPVPPQSLERLREPSLQELTQFGCSFELRDRFQFLEC